MKNTSSNRSTAPDQRLALATQIMAGLLASGHYTCSKGQDDKDGPRVRSTDFGERWREAGLPQRRYYCVVSDAAELLAQMEAELAGELKVKPRHSMAPMKDLVGGIDFPHLRGGGGWLQRGAAPDNERGFALRRACHHAEKLRACGMADADIACLLSDLYWNAVTEMDLNRQAAADNAPALQA